MTKDQIASTITRLSEESAAAEMHRTVTELESVISDLRTSAARLKRIPANSQPPDGYVDTATSAILLAVSRQRVEKLADTGKIQRITVNWRAYYSASSIRDRLLLQTPHIKFATSTTRAKRCKISPEQ